MSVLAVVSPLTTLHVKGGAIEVWQEGVRMNTVRPSDLDQVLLWHRCDLSGAARNLLLDHDVDVVFLTLDGRWRGRLVGKGSRAGARRLAQYRLCSDAGRRLVVARGLIAAKLTNQRAVLMVLQRRSRDDRMADVLVRLRAAALRCGSAASSDELMGIEGAAARAYFEGMGRALTNPGFSFTGRSRYPPRDPINAALSYGYTLLLARCEAAVRTAGLDPYLGVLHESGRGAPALALDLQEEWRPLVDRMVWSLVNRRQLCPEDFREPLADELGERADLAEIPDAADKKPRPPVYLGRVGREVLLRAWGRELGRLLPHPHSGDRWQVRDLYLEQARQLARLLDASEPVEWRGISMPT